MNNESPFFPYKDYDVPQTSNYMKPQEGKNKFRVLSSAIVGYEYWNTNNKPVRSRECPDGMPEDIKTDKDGSYRINHFWAFAVWNYQARKVQILEVTQKSIMKKMKVYIDDPDWGNPKEYDFTITRSGTGLETEYEVHASPHSELNPEIRGQYMKTDIKLEKLYDGEDPFK